MSVPPDDLRQAAMKQLQEQRDFVPHLLAYVLVNAGLIVVWGAHLDPRDLLARFRPRLLGHGSGDPRLECIPPPADHRCRRGSLRRAPAGPGGRPGPRVSARSQGCAAPLSQEDAERRRAGRLG